MCVNDIPCKSVMIQIHAQCSPTQFNPNPCRVIGVFGLSLYTGENEIRDMFSKYGPIEQVQVVYDHQTGRSRGFAFIYYEDTEDAIDVSCLLYSGSSLLRTA